MQQLPDQFVQYMQDMKDTIEAQGKKIHELENRLRVLEEKNKSDLKAEHIWMLPASIELVADSNKIFLVRPEAGMTALAALKDQVKTISIFNDCENRPQFLYVGFVDQKYIKYRNNQNNFEKKNFEEIEDIAIKNCFMFNTGGKHKIPSQEWQEFEDIVSDQIIHAQRYDISIENVIPGLGGSNVSIMCDYGRYISMFQDLPQEWRLVVGMFGEGKIRIEYQ